MYSRISQLIYRAITHNITEPELKELNESVKNKPELKELVEELSDPEFLQKEFEAGQIIDISRPRADMQRRVNIIRNRKRRRRGLAAAGVAALIAACGWLISYETNVDLSIGQTSPLTQTAIDSIRPGRSLAILSDKEGKQMKLSAVESGLVSNEIILNSSKGVTRIDKPEELCLEVPRGGEFKIVLEDSTEVWLNSESQLRYPAKFDDKERRVQVSGEVYFSVKKDTDRPFYVESMGQEIRVYGTTFNVKAYPDEKITYTTLETGSISLRKSSGEGGELYLSPGHQAVFDRVDSKVDMKQVDTQIVTGWRHGRFVLEEQPLANIMKDLSRWYDFKYEFSDPQLEQLEFMGSIPRYADFKTALSILEKSGGIEFEISDNKIRILKKVKKKSTQK